MRVRIHLVHGVLTRDPMKSIGKMKAALVKVGFSADDIVVENYGFVIPFPLTTLWKDKKEAARLCSILRPEDYNILVGHSNGSLIAEMTADMGAPVQGIVHIAPAINSGKQAGQQVKWVDVYYNPGDWVTILSGLLPAHPWGAMGAKGYTGPADSRYYEVDCSNHPGDSKVLGHSKIFKGRKWHDWGPEIATHIWARVQVDLHS